MGSIIIMAFIRATYNSGNVIKDSDLSQIATDQSNYWNTEEGKTMPVFNGNVPGAWDDKNNKFIPDDWHDIDTDWIWLLDEPWDQERASNAQYITRSI